jgi:transposase
MTGKKRREFSWEFKREAVRLLKQGDLSQAQVARDLGINPTLLGRWRAVLAREEHGAGNGVDLEELRRLRRENARLREERDILKKAAAYFAKESR